MGNPRYTMENIAKKKLHSEFIDILSEAFNKKTSAEWSEIFRANDIPYSLCQIWDEVLEDPQAWAIGAFEHVDYPSGKRIMVRVPVKIEGVETLPRGKGPLLGEHSTEILRELGYSDEELKKLHEKGVYCTWEDVKGICGG